MGDLSPHFNRSEFRCQGHGKVGHVDHPTMVDAELVAALERLRTLGGNRPLKVVSGHRCAWWNSRVGGAKGSMHLWGMATDLQTGTYRATLAERAGFRGIGTVGPWATHVDVRAERARWEY